MPETTGIQRSVEYQNASLYLFTKLSGLDQNQTPITGARNYFTFKPSMLGTNTDANGNTIVAYIRDPFGNSYGYSTIQAATQDAAKGYNPTFDLWSTGWRHYLEDAKPVDQKLVALCLLLIPSVASAAVYDAPIPKLRETETRLLNFARSALRAINTHRSTALCSEHPLSKPASQSAISG